MDLNGPLVVQYSSMLNHSEGGFVFGKDEGTTGFKQIQA